MWYSEKDFEAIERDKRSLVVAFANLAQKFDKQVDPVDFYATLTQDGPEVDWWSVAEYVDGIDIGRVVDDGSWPDSSEAVVKFRRLDTAAAGLVDHYCLVADHRVHSIIDSLDSKIKSAVEYGEVIGWASYVPETPDEDLPEIEEKILIEATHVHPKTLYVLAEGENVWDAARKLSVKVDDLLKFNEIEDPRSVKPGDMLRIPVGPIRDTKAVTYEVLAEPKFMYVSNPNGTTKFSFGNATKWSDIKPTTRRYGYGHPVVITAIARVPLSDETESAAYYMEAVDAGQFVTEDSVKFTVGFSHSHLKEGEPVIVKPVEAKIDIKPLMEGLEIPKPEPKPTMEEPLDPEAWKKTQKPINAEQKPVLYLASENLIVNDMEGKGSPKPVPRFRGVLIYSTFEKQGVVYARPMQSARTGTWYGIPMDKLLLEDELYNINVSLADRVSMHGTLTIQERGVVVLSKILSQGVRIKTMIRKQK